MLSYDIYFFETEDEDFLELAKFDGHRLGRQVHFLNYVNPFVVKDRVSDGFCSQSPIYLKNVLGQFVTFENNTFDSNIGIHGGAIHIDNRNSSRISSVHFVRSPFIYFLNNTFSRNMAYFEGNAIYIQGGQKNEEQVTEKAFLQIEI